MIEGELAAMWIVIGTVFVSLAGMCVYLAYRVETLTRQVRNLRRRTGP
ncbi:hypothetical protein [Actinomadura violacea]|uniref:CcmD family protein n=1 Tax=Actinomadura violacea TaxID=2819934 RepID=A0ABS3RRK6_9ACTN|nr:hypothetical protein [Actinomadura violacea]MBO2459390.1 hypothetical protein [Actinomadura violacea]